MFGSRSGASAAFLGEFGSMLREAFSIGGEESLERYLTKADGTQVGAQTLEAMMARMAAGAAARGPSPAGQPEMPPERMREQQRLMAYQLAEAVVRG